MTHALLPFRAALAALLLASPIAMPVAQQKPAQPLTAEQQKWLSKGTRAEQDGWVSLRIAGSPRELGFQHGYLLAPEIKASLEMVRKKWFHDSGMEWPWLVEQGDRILRPKVDAKILEEIEGLVEGLAAAGVKTTLAEMIAFNGFIDLDYWWSEAKDSIGARSPDSPQEGCSSFIVTGSMTPDGGIVLGHNTMTSYLTADPNIALDITPQSGHRILMQGSPGWVHSGTDFFITDAGLVGSETTISGFSGFDESGTPEFVRMRRATEDASSIDEWCAIMLKGNNGGYANAWLIGDINTGEIARLELGLKHTSLERTKDGYFVGSNIAENIKILRLETNVDETDIRNSDIARRVRWKQLMEEHRGKITLEHAKRFEGDHYDTYLRRDRPGGRCLCAHWDVDSTEISFAPFTPYGTVDAKVVDTKMAREMSFAARWGSGCGTPFDAAAFLKARPQFDWMEGILFSRKSYPWTDIKPR
ncbi:MAG: phospholipase [Bacteroidetes bacterium]|nr:phospholipase [Bacteroidota bacterium]